MGQESDSGGQDASLGILRKSRADLLSGTSGVPLDVEMDRSGKDLALDDGFHWFVSVNWGGRSVPFQAYGDAREPR